MENENKPKIILGIDISTSCLGVSLAKYDGKEVEILKISHVKPKIPRKIKGTEVLFLKAKQFEEQFVEKYKDIGVTDVVIEEPLPSANNSNTVSTLLRFNGMISQSIYRLLGVIPEYISSYDARKFAFPELMAIRKYNKEGEVYPIKKIRKAVRKNELKLWASYPWDCAKKMVLWNKINEMFPGITWEYNKKGDLKTENFDASDSLVCVLGYINKMKYGDTEPKIVKSNEEIIKVKRKTITKINYTVDFCGRIIEKTIEL